MEQMPRHRWHRGLKDAHSGQEMRFASVIVIRRRDMGAVLVVWSSWRRHCSRASTRRGAGTGAIDEPEKLLAGPRTLRPGAVNGFGGWEFLPDGAEISRERTPKVHRKCTGWK
jgi:hypothetical protein